MKTVRSKSQEKREPGICMGDIYGYYIVCSYYFFLSPKLKKKLLEYRPIKAHVCTLIQLLPYGSWPNEAIDSSMVS
jgi:hypothetical protein